MSDFILSVDEMALQSFCTVLILLLSFTNCSLQYYNSKEHTARKFHILFDYYAIHTPENIILSAIASYLGDSHHIILCSFRHDPCCDAHLEFSSAFGNYDKCLDFEGWKLCKKCDCLMSCYYNLCECIKWLTLFSFNFSITINQNSIAKH